MPKAKYASNEEVLRKLLTDAFSLDELSNLAFDLFPDHHQDIDWGSRPNFIRGLISLSKRQNKVDELLEKVEEQNKTQYDRYAPYLTGDFSAAGSGLAILTPVIPNRIELILERISALADILSVRDTRYGYIKKEQEEGQTLILVLPSEVIARLLSLQETQSKKLAELGFDFVDFAPDLSEAELSGVNFTGANLHKTSIRKAQLNNANMNGSDLSESDLTAASMENVDLRGANLDKANLSNATLSGASLREAKLTDANLSGTVLANADMKKADLTAANLYQANLQDANLEYVQLNYADLREAKLSFAFLRYANLSGANLGEANLTGVQLRGANMQQANLAKANMHDSDLTGATMQGVDLSGAKMQGTDLRNANLSDADLGNANLSGATMHGVDLTNAKLLAADLEGSNLSKANLTGAQLSGAKMQGVDLSKAILRGSNLQGADLSGATLHAVDFSGVSLRGAKLYGAILSEIDLRETDLHGADLRGVEALGYVHLNEAALDEEQRKWVGQTVDSSSPDLTRRTALGEGLKDLDREVETPTIGKDNKNDSNQRPPHRIKRYFDLKVFDALSEVFVPAIIFVVLFFLAQGVNFEMRRTIATTTVGTIAFVYFIPILVQWWRKR